MSNMVQKKMTKSAALKSSNFSKAKKPAKEVTLSNGLAEVTKKPVKQKANPKSVADETVEDSVFEREEDNMVVENSEDETQAVANALTVTENKKAQKRKIQLKPSAELKSSTKPSTSKVKTKRIKEVTKKPVKQKANPETVEDSDSEREEENMAVQNPEDETQAVANVLTITENKKETQKRKIQLKPRAELKSSTKPSTSKVKTKRIKVELPLPSLKTLSGKVFVIGENDVGQLGLGEDVEVKKRPALLDLPYSIVDIAAGGMHSVCLTESGEVITFGCNDEGALGRLTTDEGSEYVPQKVEIPERIVRVSAGDSHSAALSESGQVYIWGNFRGGNGPMGLMSDGSRQVKPVKILVGVQVVAISSGNEHLVCLSSECSVFTCGCGEAGQLGRLTERASKTGGRKGLAALLEPGVVPISSSGKNIKIEEVWTGSYSTFLKAKFTGAIWTFGLNNYNQLGFEHVENEEIRYIPKHVTSFDLNAWKQISGGQHHTLTLNEQGSVYSMGREDYGRLGLGESCGDKSSPTIIPTLEDQKCTEISCGNVVSFAVSEEGAVYSWGFGDSHQLGHGSDSDCLMPKAIEGSFATSWKAIKVAGGGQHTLILASPRNKEP